MVIQESSVWKFWIVALSVVAGLIAWRLML